MKFSSSLDSPLHDTWVWGRETLLWGYEPEHEYTLKILEPKVGREGCLSLQYHRQKSESWFVLQGVIWALIVQEDKVITRLMRPGDFQNLPTGTIHRLMGVSPGAQVLESSTPDRHAADKSVPKDVVRLHCVLGRECEPYEVTEKQWLIENCIEISEQAMDEVALGKYPREVDVSQLTGAGKVDLKLRTPTVS